MVVFLILLCTIAGMSLPALCFLVARKAFEKRWQIFIASAGTGQLVAFLLGYTFYLQFVR
jgi:hypothetical protein